jgi:hypothetical protein
LLIADSIGREKTQKTQRKGMQGALALLEPVSLTPDFPCVAGEHVRRGFRRLRMTDRDQRENAASMLTGYTIHCGAFQSP